VALFTMLGPGVQAKTLAKNIGAWVTVSVLTDTVLVENQVWLDRAAFKAASRVGSLRSASAWVVLNPSRRRLAA